VHSTPKGWGLGIPFQSCLPQFVAIEPIAERGVLCGNLDRDQAPGGAGLIARGPEFHQQFLTRERHRRQLLEPRPQPLQLAPPHGPLLGDASTILIKGISEPAVGESDISNDVISDKGIDPGRYGSLRFQLDVPVCLQSPFTNKLEATMQKHFP
jgi:hypothetical protein